MKKKQFVETISEIYRQKRYFFHKIIALYILKERVFMIREEKGGATITNPHQESFNFVCISIKKYTIA